ncbi:GNAT family N-acetyltransferase [Flavobacteriaceae bacterium 3-367]|uniref:GNAT family N-acetyltransferase n=1 Tax=Eudoraea algarum TaxID=3417568 RepID=UPI0032777315
MDYLLEGETTQRLSFRKLLKTDFGEWLPFHQDKRSSQFWEGLPESPEEACTQQFDRTFERYEKGLGGMNALVLKSNGKLVGLCGLLVQEVDQRRELEIGYSILPGYWKQGYASEAALKCKNFAFARGLADSLISIIQVDNIPSQKVAKQLGMQLDTTTVYRDNPVHIFRVYPQ